MRSALARQGVRLLAGVTAAVFSLTACGDPGVNEVEDPEEVPDVRGEDDPTDIFTGAYDSEFREDMTAYTGQEVTLTAEVDEVLSPEAFSITSPDGEDVEPLLVLADGSSGAVEAGSAVTIAATPFDEFDPAEAEQQIEVDLEDDLYADWEGEPFLVATTVESGTRG
jgi:hypothetical protein